MKGALLTKCRGVLENRTILSWRIDREWSTRSGSEGSIKGSQDRNRNSVKNGDGEVERGREGKRMRRVKFM